MTTGVATEADRIPVWNWTREQVSYARAEVEVHDVNEIRQILGDPDRYPSPVRGLASRHSTTRCGEADGGTVVDVRGLNRILDIGADSVTAEPGALYIDVAKELEKRGLQFYVNIELGNLSLGAAATCATKDASMPGEFGQVNSYAVGMKVLTPAGDLVEINEDDPGLLQAARSSYGLFGIIVEVTFRVRPLQAMAVYHEVFKLDDFISRLPDLVARGESMMLYIFPYLGQIVVEFRRYTGAESEATNRSRHFGWRARNFAWSKGVPTFAYLAERYIPSRRLRYGAVNAVNRLAVPAMMRRVVSYGHTIPTDQMIRYSPEAGRSKYTFSIWAFPEETYGETLREYFRFAKAYYERVGWRPNMTHVGYRIKDDQSSLFSYTYNGTALTIDPVCTGAPGWNDFLDAYNAFCSDHGGSPLLNQTPRLTQDHVRRAFGGRLERFQEYRRRFDPHDRLLNGYFRELLR